MLNNTLLEIKKMILNDKKNECLIEFTLIFHNGDIQKYHYSKTEISIITQGDFKEDKYE